MSFFEGIPRPSPPSDPERIQPEWAGPPPRVMPGVSSQQAVLFKTERAAAALYRLLAYPTGLEFTIDTWFRSHTDGRRLGRELHGTFFPGEEPASNDGWRFGVEYPDGSRWTNMSHRFPHFEQAPPSPVVVPQGGGGSDDRWTQRFWLWPLPAEGMVRIVVAWPALSVDEHSVTIDASELRRVANESQELWPPVH